MKMPANKQRSVMGSENLNTFVLFYVCYILLYVCFITESVFNVKERLFKSFILKFFMRSALMFGTVDLWSFMTLRF